jgi:hypothetical protein
MKKCTKVDFAYLERALDSLPQETAIKVESIKSGLTPRGVRRAIRKAVKAGAITANYPELIKYSV